jgi:hypothetical protein
MWRFDPSNLQWQWVAGDKLMDTTGTASNGKSCFASEKKKCNN